MNVKIIEQEPEVEEIIFADKSINEKAAKVAKLIGRMYGIDIARN